MTPPTLRSLTAKFYSYAFFVDFVLIYPFYTLLFSQSSMNPVQIASFLIAWSTTSFILEVPSGAVADRFNRKHVLILATLFKATGFASWLFFPNYVGFLAGFILWGMSSALTSGTQEALLYDELAKLDQVPLYAKITGRIESMHLAGIIAADFVAAMLAGHGYTILLVASVAALLLAALSVGLLPRSIRTESASEPHYLGYLKSGLREAFGKPVVLLILLLIAITGLASVDEYFSLLLQEKAFDNSAIAFWSGVIGLFGIIGSLLAHRLENRRLPLEALLVVWAILLLASGVLGGIAVPIALGLFTLLYYILKVIFTSRLQHAVSGATRATTASVGGLLEEIFALIAYGVIGFTALTGNYHRGFILFSGIIALAAAAFWLFARFISRKYNVERIGL